MNHTSRRLLVSLFILAALLTVQPSSGEAAGLNVTQVYLPLLAKSQVSIFGHFTLGGAPAIIHNIQLHIHNPSSTTIATTQTQPDGTYAFLDVPSLAAGETYNVVQSSDDLLPAQLSLWFSRTISSYTAGDVIDLGTADLADIELVAPDYYATVPLPATFSWTPRPATPTDIYELQIAEANDGNPYSISPKLGYVDHYTLKSLPAGFDTDWKYYWDVWVYQPDGSKSRSGESPFFWFSTSSQSEQVK
jgi:hypothetical protein